MVHLYCYGTFMYRYDINIWYKCFFTIEFLLSVLTACILLAVPGFSCLS